MQWNKPGSEKGISYVLPHMWNLKKMTRKQKGDYEDRMESQRQRAKAE